MWDYFDGLSAGEFWTDFGDVALRAFLSIVVLFILTKLMGNKQISQLNFFDYIIGISIGSIAAEMATTTDRPHHFFVLAMVIYTIITVLITYIARKSIAMRRFFNGTPVPLVENGKIIEKNLVKAGFDVNDLLTELRYAGYFNIEDVQYALEETDGRVSIIPRPSARPATCEDLKITDAKPTLPQSDVIIDGKIMTNNLKSVKKKQGVAARRTEKAQQKPQGHFARHVGLRRESHNHGQRGGCKKIRPLQLKGKTFGAEKGFSAFFIDFFPHLFQNNFRKA